MRGLLSHRMTGKSRTLPASALLLFFFYLQEQKKLFFSSAENFFFFFLLFPAVRHMEISINESR